LVIAHRGASGTAPENTLAAIKQAMAVKADGIEVDVQLTKDDALVIIHDRAVDRTTDGRGPVNGLTLCEIRQLDAGRWFNRTVPPLASEAFVGLTVPTLEAVIDLTAEANLRLYLDVKYAKWPEPLPSMICQIITGKNCWDRVILTSSDHASLCTMKKVEPRARTAHLFDWRSAKKGARYILRLAEKWRADELALHHAVCSDELIERAHLHGLTVAVWTVNQRRMMRRFLKSAVNAIMTDFPERLQSELSGDDFWRSNHD
jgi:glycerophosphoryl diester phosphodiesterase